MGGVRKHSWGLSGPRIGFVDEIDLTSVATVTKLRSGFYCY